MKSFALWVLLGLTTAGCTLSLDGLRFVRAEQLAARGRFEDAVKILIAIKDREPDSERALEAARLGARWAQTEVKNFEAALAFHRHIILKSADENERTQAQRNIAQIYFDNLQDYNQAVHEYEKLLKIEKSDREKFRYRLHLARSHFQLNNLDQAEMEVDSLLSLKLSDDEKFDALVVRANIETSNKKHGAAAATWEQILRDFPERAKRENAALNLVVCYEEMKDFEKAILTLESIKADYPNPDFLEIRIARLKERKINQPGAQGWRR